MSSNQNRQLTGDPILFVPTLHSHFIPSFVAIHTACVMTDHTIATFLPPLSANVLGDWYHDRATEVSEGTRLIVMQLGKQDDPMGADELAGFVMLDMKATETGPFRAWVEKLLVSPEWRQMGVAKRIMGALETYGLENGNTLMVR